MKLAELLSYLERFMPQDTTLELRSGVGIAIPIPVGVSAETKRELEEELIRRYWAFDFATIGRKEYVVIFPLLR